MSCLFKPDMHHTCLRIMPWLCDGCLLCCLLLFGLLLALASVSFRSYEDPFFYVRLSSSWTRSSSLRGLRQDDHTLEITSIFLASCSFYCYVALPTTCLSCLPYCHLKPLTHLVLANRCLAMLPLCSAPLIALLVAGEDWSWFHVGTWIFCWDITISLI